MSFNTKARGSDSGFCYGADSVFGDSESAEMVADCGLAVNKCINLLNLGYKILKMEENMVFLGVRPCFRLT